MKIVVLDGFAGNPGDLSWEGLNALGECVVYDRTEPTEVMERVKDAEVVLTNKVPFGRERIESLPALKYIGVLATGYNIIDTAVAAERGIVVTNVPAYSTASVAQMVFAHLLNVVTPVAEYAREVRSGRWSRCKDFSYISSPVLELAGKTFGIVGLGQIGMAVAKIALSLGMKVIAYTSKPQGQLPPGVESVDMDALFSRSDVLSLHCPLTPDTAGLVCRRRLAMMKPQAILINTGRGQLVDEQDLADALRGGVIAAACLDVLSQEPPAANNPLLSAPNCHITPHIAWASWEARARLMRIAVENVRRFIAGTPQNVVD
ncbi:MAG: D-2-hydroxyacid dehydrogenase [Muribaculaceae bacterium]|nr:D-2-hydroxyacid dehydrogenase [Muribaculaceae bacterium]